MRATKKALVSLIGDAVARARVTAMLRELTGTSCVCLTADEVRARLHAGSVQVLILEAHDREGRPTAPLVAEIRRDFPSVSIIAYWEPGRTPSSAIVPMMHAGAHQLITHPHDDAQCAFKTAFLDAERRTVADHVLAALADVVPPVARPLIDLYLRGADGPMPVTEAARQLGVHRKTLRNRMDAAGLPAPADLRAWCRMFMAGRLLDEPGRTVESVALQLEFTTGSALRNLIKRRTGLAPYMLRDAGGLQYLITCFTALCADRRRASGRDGSCVDAMPHDGSRVDARLADAPPAPAASVARVAEPTPRRTRRRRAAAEPTTSQTVTPSTQPSTRSSTKSSTRHAAKQTATHAAKPATKQRARRTVTATP
jgi:AraC-like DNA-binding protein